MSHSHKEQEVVWCDICNEFYAESRVDVLAHIHDEHTLKEKIDHQLKRGPPPEDTNA